MEGPSASPTRKARIARALPCGIVLCGGMLDDRVTGWCTTRQPQLGDTNARRDKSVTSRARVEEFARKTSHATKRTPVKSHVSCVSYVISVIFKSYGVR